MTTIAPILRSIANGAELSVSELEAAFTAILSGNVSDIQVSAFVMGLAVRGETGAELLAGARVMRSHARTLEISGDVLDTCGTGGLGWASLNTSTASAIVIAACGGKVAKHGNRSTPPKTGSADVLEALGVELDLSPDRFNACIESVGVGFMFARSHHSAMRHVAPVRADLGIRTIFNLLGPLSNPANATHQVLGVYDSCWLRPMAEALCALGVKRAWIVHGRDGIDELSIAGTSDVVEVADGSLREFVIEPKDAGLTSSPLSALEGGSPDQNATAIRDIFEGRPGPFRDAVVLNAAAGLVVLGKADDLLAGAQQAATAIDTGKALETLTRLAAISQGEKS